MIDFNAFPGEVEKYPEVFEKVEAKKAFNTAFRWKIMTDDIKALGFQSKTDETRDFNDRDKYDSVSSSDFNVAAGPRRVNANRQGGFNGDHCIRRARVNGHFAHSAQFAIYDFGFAKNNAVADVKRELIHKEGCRLKCGGVTLRKFVFGVFHKSKPFSFFEGNKFFINFIPMGIMGDKPTGNRRGRGLIHFSHLNEQPFAMKSFFERFNFFNFHNNILIELYCLCLKNNTEDWMGQYLFILRRGDD